VAHLGAARERARAVRQVVPAHDCAKLHAACAAAPGRHSAGPHFEGGAATCPACGGRVVVRAKHARAPRLPQSSSCWPCMPQPGERCFRLDAHWPGALTQRLGLQSLFHTRHQQGPSPAVNRDAWDNMFQATARRGARARTLLAGSGARPAARARPAAGTCGASAGRGVGSPRPSATHKSLLTCIAATRCKARCPGG